MKSFTAAYTWNDGGIPRKKRGEKEGEEAGKKRRGNAVEKPKNRKDCGFFPKTTKEIVQKIV